MQHPSKRIFAALDGSEAMYAVIERAMQIAEEEEAALRLGHVVDMLPADANAANHDALCASVRQRLYEDIGDVMAQARRSERIASVELCVAAGPVRRTLVKKLIDPWRPDAVVCGTRDLSKLEYTVRGSVSAYLTRNLNCPVLVVRR